MKYFMILFPFFCFSVDKAINDHCDNGISLCEECMQISNIPSEFYFYLGKYCAYKEIKEINEK